jgi:hypothetical protein
MRISCSWAEPISETGRGGHTRSSRSPSRDAASGVGDKNGWRPASVSWFFLAAGFIVAVATGCSPRKKLLEWGWDEPDTAFLRQNIREMEKTPFDGCVFNVRHRADGGGSFTWQFWGSRGFSATELFAAFDDLRALRPRQFTENFLRVNVTPGDLDWFDDFSAIRTNARLAGEMARTGRSRGVVLDVEQYQGQLFDYRSQKLAPSRPWDAYAAQARIRGREVMSALQEGYPGLTVFLSFGHSLPWVLSEHGRRPLSDISYGLLAPFLDGMVEAAHGRTRLVDGYELSYGFLNPRHFDDARQLVEEGVKSIVGVPGPYRRRLQLAFGIWLDYDWRHRGWSTQEPSRNYFSPDRLESTLVAALRTSDEYVWIYGETPRWWGSTKPEARVPHAYVSAIRRARAGAR